MLTLSWNLCVSKKNFFCIILQVMSRVKFLFNQACMPLFHQKVWDKNIFSGFLDAQLACTEQQDDALEKKICLPPVQWMFDHLDIDGDGYLTATELHEIEQINNEHCIKPFLTSCDSNNDGQVVLKEFCKCLCVGMEHLSV